MSLIIQPAQVAEKSILDVNGKQIYLGNGFVSGTQFTAAGSTAETPYVLITNPANSGKSMFSYIRKHGIATTSNAYCIFRHYINPTVTSNGTAVGIGNSRINANSPTSVMKIYSGPSVSANGTFAADVEATNASSPTASNVLFILDPGNSVLITTTASASAPLLAWEILWYELPYGTQL